MLQHMKVVDANGESQMDEDQWEAASECQPSAPSPTRCLCCTTDIYIAFAFEKRARRPGTT